MSQPSTIWGSATDWRPPAAGEVDVWRASLEVEPALVGDLASLLTPEELARTGRRRTPQAQGGAVASRALLRLLLARYTGLNPEALRFNAGSHGKPEVRPSKGQPEIAFNVSHSDGMALVAVAPEGTIGVDVERIRPGLDWKRLAGRYFAPQEVDWLQQQPDGGACEAFFRLWTCKEAVVKALGVGLSLPFCWFVVSSIPASDPQVQFIECGKGEGDEWQLIELTPGAGFAATLAVQRGRGEVRPVRIRCWDWEWGGVMG